MRCLKYFSVVLTSLSLICGTGAFASDGPRFDMDSNGNAVAAWLTNVTGGLVVQANFKVGSSWDTAVEISDVNSVSIDYPVVKAVANGSDISAVVIWTAYNATDGVTSLYAAMLPSSSGGWTNPAQVSDTGENVVAPQFDLRVDAAGDVIAVWTSSDSSNQYIRSATAQIGSSNAWSSPVYISGP